MMPADILPPETSVSDRLLTTIFLTALFHLVMVLGITFGAPDSSPAGHVPSLDIMLVSDEIPESERNDQAQYLAQRTQQGAGNMDRPDKSRTPGTGGNPDESSGEFDGDAYVWTQAGRTGGESGTLTADSNRGELVYVADADEGGAPARPRQMSSGATTPLPSALDDEELRLKGSRARELLVTPSTRASTVSVYLDAWRRKVERVGTLHFPNEARRRHMSGSPVLEVALRDDGRLAEVWIRRSSGHAELDQAAVGVLKLASPFDPFPPALAAGHDTLRFAYEWQFIGGSSAGSIVSSVHSAD
jgi:protein TonB